MAKVGEEKGRTSGVDNERAAMRALRVAAGAIAIARLDHVQLCMHTTTTASHKQQPTTVHRWHDAFQLFAPVSINNITSPARIICIAENRAKWLRNGPPEKQASVYHTHTHKSCYADQQNGYIGSSAF